MSGLPFPGGPRNKMHTCERLPRQELAHVAQLIPQWTGGWAWCHPLPSAAFSAPYKDLHHMVLMALSLLAPLYPLRWVVFPQGWGCIYLFRVMAGAMCGVDCFFVFFAATCIVFFFFF